ncbi:MAG: histidine kinase [Bacteroidia bacterium]|jgi:histidine kinase
MHIKKLNELHNSENSIVYKGIEEKNGKSIVIKVLKNEFPSIKEIAKFNEEFEITNNLRVDGVRKAFTKYKIDNRHALLLDFVEGKSLREVLDEKKRLEINEFLLIAIGLCSILEKVHAKGVIHKDINPRNILIQSENNVSLIDFGISSKVRKQTQVLESINKLEGTLAYISPEQTGRMNRSVDYRTDIYSLGITFYEMLTGEMPFKGEDSIELIHAHIAKEALPVNVLKYGSIPGVLSQIIQKMLAKNAEERYQNCYGLRKDLERCEKSLSENNQIPDFKIGMQDFADRFQVPEKLYGRESEISSLLDTFRNSTLGTKELMLVSGYSGIGKTALVNEIHKLISEKRAYFAAGKFDQFQRDIPYSAIIHALKDFVAQILTESNQDIAQWKRIIRNALGNNGRVIQDVVPNLAHIVGEQPEIPELGPAETQNRFNLVFQNFVREISREEHPLVLFIDDWQWADMASLNFLKLLFSDETNQYLMVIGAYRNNEVDETHPFIKTLNHFKENSIPYQEIDLQPLKQSSIENLVSDTLKIDKESKGLAELVHLKTQGNPFFATQFLEMLYEEKLLKFDTTKSKWDWDLEEIKKKDITDNVVELLANKILKLSKTTQKLLKAAACIGSEFDLKTLSFVAERNQKEVLTDLWEAVEEGLIKPIGENYKAVGELVEDAKAYFIFLHDRVQQATYSLIKEEVRQKTNLKIGRLAYRNNDEAYITEWICEITNYYNVGAALIHKAQEKELLVDINLRAGLRARKSTAYEAAVKYFSMALSESGKIPWKTNYSRTLEIYSYLAECQFLSVAYEESEKSFDEIFSHVENILDKVDIYIMKIIQYESVARYAKTVVLIKEVLSILGVTLPEDDDEKMKDFQEEVEFISGKIDEVESIDNFMDLPENTNPEVERIIQILTIAYGPVYMAGDMNLLLLVSAKNVAYTLKNGLSIFSSWGFAAYSTFVSAGLQQYTTAYSLCELAVKLNQKYPNPSLTGAIYHLMGCFTNPWINPIRENTEIFDKAYGFCMQTGNFPYAAYAYGVKTRHLFLSGMNRFELSKRCDEYALSLKKIQNFAIADILTVVSQTLECLAGNTESQYSLTGNGFVEDDYEKNYEAVPIFPAVRLPLKSFVHYLYGDYETALQLSKKADEYMPALFGMVWNSFHQSTHSLTLCALAKSDLENKDDYLKEITEKQAQMKVWAESAPHNFKHQYLLVQAEIANIQEDKLEAMDLYDESIRLAQENGFVQYEAIANELAGKFYLGWNKSKIASPYLQQAKYSYELWGATAKADDLAKQYPNLADNSSRSNLHTRNIGITTQIDHTRPFSSTTTTQGGSAFDLDTLVKASNTLSGEIKLDNLLKKMMLIVMENAGADKGILALKDGNEFFVQATHNISENHIAVLQRESLKENQNIPASLITYGIRTKNSLVLEDATQNKQFKDLPYVKVHKPKSVMIVPILKQGEVIAVLYLSNKQVAGVFTQERLSLVNMLSSQIAISIGNAILYQNMEQVVAERTEQLQEKSQRITDSILYAENIQAAILPYKDEFEESFAEHFVIYRPKDIVSGDFYWMAKINDTVLLALIDCTGHGVPGAFMSMIANTLLNEAVLQKECTDPAEILASLHVNIRKSLRQEQGVNTDGMDMGICAITQENDSALVIYAGAKRPIWVAKDGEFEIISGDRKSIGGMQKEDKRQFNNKEIKLSKGDVIYLTTDGLADQNNPEYKKFGSRRLKELLASYVGIPLDRQRELLENNLDVFQAKEAQRDDISMIAVRF